MPKSLCKFTTADGAAKIIQFNSIFITSPLDLNDPFEMRPAWTNLLALNQFEDQGIRAAITGGMIGADKPVPVEMGFGIADRQNQPVFEELHSHFRILSLLPPILDIEKNFSESKPEDILMWSHYGDNNQGICLILDTEKFNNGEKVGGFPVQYDEFRKSMPPERYAVYKRISEDRNDAAVQARHELLYNAYIEVLTRKSPLWSYEREVRMIYEFNNRNPRSDFGKVDLPCPVCVKVSRPKDACKHTCYRETVKIPHEAVLGVVFGADCPEEYGDPILTALEDNRYGHVKLYRSELHAAEYRMQYMENNAEGVRSDLHDHSHRIGMAKHHYSATPTGLSMPPYGARKTVNFIPKRINPPAESPPESDSNLKA